MKLLNPSFSKVDLWYKSLVQKSGMIQTHNSGKYPRLDTAPLNLLLAYNPDFL